MNKEKTKKEIHNDIKKLRASLRDKYEKLSVELRDAMLKIDNFLAQIEEIGGKG